MKRVAVVHDYNNKSKTQGISNKNKEDNFIFFHSSLCKSFSTNRFCWLASF